MLGLPPIKKENIFTDGNIPEWYDYVNKHMNEFSIKCHLNRYGYFYKSLRGVRSIICIPCIPHVYAISLNQKILSYKIIRDNWLISHYDYDSMEFNTTKEAMDKWFLTCGLENSPDKLFLKDCGLENSPFDESLLHITLLELDIQKECKKYKAQEREQAQSCIEYIEKAMALYESQREKLEDIIDAGRDFKPRPIGIGLAIINAFSSYITSPLDKMDSWYNISKYIWLEIPFSTILHLSENARDKDSIMFRLDNIEIEKTEEQIKLESIMDDWYKHYRYTHKDSNNDKHTKES